MWTASGWQARCEAAGVTAFGRTMADAAERLTSELLLAGYAVPEAKPIEWREPKRSCASAHHRVRAVPQPGETSEAE